MMSLFGTLSKIGEISSAHQKKHHFTFEFVRLIALVFAASKLCRCQWPFSLLSLTLSFFRLFHSVLSLSSFTKAAPCAMSQNIVVFRLYFSSFPTKNVRFPIKIISFRTIDSQLKLMNTMEMSFAHICYVDDDANKMFRRTHTNATKQPNTERNERI